MQSGPSGERISKMYHLSKKKDTRLRKKDTRLRGFDSAANLKSITSTNFGATNLSMKLLNHIYIKSESGC